VLETLGAVPDDATLRAWSERVVRLRGELGWPDGPIVTRVHATGAALAFAAPIDQLFTATEINEWAWLATHLPFSPREKVPEERMREEAPSFRVIETSSHKLPFDAQTLAFVRSLRETSTDTERWIWSFLRDRRVLGQKFRRQYAIAPYVLDFYCHELKLAIEIDGGQHNDAANAQHDARRNEYMAARGIRTLRYWNHDVQQQLEDVLADIWRCVSDLISEIGDSEARGGIAPSSPLRGPSPGGRREERHESGTKDLGLLPFSLREKVPEGRMREAADNIPQHSLEANAQAAKVEWSSQQFHSPGHPAAWDEDSALHTLRAFARGERCADVAALVEAAEAHGLSAFVDDDELSIGEGSGSQTWPLAALPTVTEIDWNHLHDIPVALVTGSNGKTTTVRLLAAMTRAHGWHSAHSCTDGLFIDNVALETGDYSGPAGARTLLRNTRADVAVLETARGGILRRGIAPQHALAAVVTNISDDHFGEYGIHDLDDLATVKLVVAQTLGSTGLLVLNAEDAVLVRHADALRCRLAWFALDDGHALLRTHRERGGATCGVRDGRVHLFVDGIDHDLGAVEAMPLAFAGRAGYNIANIAAASLAATALGIPVETIASVLMSFGSTHADNPGRLQHWSFGSLSVFLDYAHNPEGLRGLLDVAAARRGDGRLALVLGQAGNRGDVEIRELAAVAAGFHPEHIVLKDIAAMLRGRVAGAVPALLRDALHAQGVDDRCIVDCLDEAEAARNALAWARAGDVVVLPIHSSGVRDEISGLLDGLLARNWRAGEPF
jgi:UDP-N-acetylmuramyl tripeptide synthase/very-short-patch-repair endonuclease